MNTLKYQIPENQSEDYSPKLTLKIVELTQTVSAKLPKEILIEQLNEFSSIVDHDEIHLVGIKVIVTPNSPYDAIQTVKQLIADGTCQLLDELLLPQKPGQYIAAVSEVKSGIDFFAIENNIDWSYVGCLNPRTYYSFATKINGKDETIFGRCVSDFKNDPKECVTAKIPSGLWVRFYQKQINNDDTSIFFEGIKEHFFQEHPEFVEDYSCRSGLYIAQYEQGASFSFPIKRVIT